MQSYDVLEPFAYSVMSAEGEVSGTFPAGVIDSPTAEEATALEMAVNVGLAVRAEVKAVKPTPTKESK